MVRMVSAALSVYGFDLYCCFIDLKIHFTDLMLFLRPYTVELQWLEHLWDLEISSRKRLFEPMRVDNSARSGGIISFRLSSIYSYVVCSHYNRLIEVILMRTHDILFSI